jgi:hypothetical protein
MASIVLRVLEQMNSRTLRYTALRLSSQRTPAGGLGRRQLRSAAPPSHKKSHTGMRTYSLAAAGNPARIEVGNAFRALSIWSARNSYSLTNLGGRGSNFFGRATSE